MLATTPFINPHDKGGKKSESVDCAHIFLHPLTWMRPCLFPGAARGNRDSSLSTPASSDITTTNSDEAPLSGRLTCPNSKCEANVGKFAWQGLQCSCGKWVVPAIGVARARVDVTERKNHNITNSNLAADGNNGHDNGSSRNNDVNSRLGAMGIRLPPHMRVATQEHHDQSPKNNL